MKLFVNKSKSWILIGFLAFYPVELLMNHYKYSLITKRLEETKEEKKDV